MSLHPIPTVTVVGAGLGGLITAIELAEAGLPVEVLEARSRPGGRARSLAGPYAANFGPHALYSTTVLWHWLRRRGLQGTAIMPKSPRIAFRWNGTVSRLPPRAALALLRLRSVAAPVDEDLRTWATSRWGPEQAAALSAAAGALTFDHDPGRLSAAFVVERFKRIVLKPAPTARYVAGGWTSLIDSLVAYADGIGVDFEVGAHVDSSSVSDLATKGPVVLAVGPGSARRLLGDDVAPRERRRAVLLDVAVDHHRSDPYLIIDLDEALFSTRTTAVVSTLAPQGEELIQLVGGMAPGERLDHAERRLETLLDVAMGDWRTRLRWRRRSSPVDATGAVDLPGATWRDRPSTKPAPGIRLVGDWVAAPGHLAEVSANSAIAAAEAIRTSIGRARSGADV